MRTHGLCIALGLAGVVLAGCGDDSDQDAKRPEPTSMVTPTNLDEFLLEAEEVPGLRPVSTPMTPLGAPVELDRAGAELLRRGPGRSTSARAACVRADAAPVRPDTTSRPTGGRLALEANRVDFDSVFFVQFEDLDANPLMVCQRS